MNVLTNFTSLCTLPFVNMTLDSFIKSIEASYNKTIDSIQLINVPVYMSVPGYLLTNRANGMYILHGGINVNTGFTVDYQLPSSALYVNIGLVVAKNLYTTTNTARFGCIWAYVIDFKN